MPLNKYASYITNVCPTTLLLWSTHRPHFTVQSIVQAQNQQKSPTATLQIIAKRARDNHVAQMPHICPICKLAHMQLSHNYVSIHTSQELTAINSAIMCSTIQKIHIVGMFPWRTMSATSHLYVPLHLYCSVLADPTLLHIQLKTATNCNFHLPCYDYVPIDMLIKYHTCQVLHVHIWYNYAHIYTLYELDANNNMDQEHWYTYISHYWHMPWNKYACHTAHICPTSFLL